MLYLVGLTFNGIFFRRVLDASPTPVGLFAAVRAYLVSHLGKYVPGKAMVVVVRVGLVTPYGARPATAAFATLYETLVMMASGGLSHVVMDEDLDRVAIDAMQRNDRDALCALPRERLYGGTSEILNWVALAGAMEPATMTLLDYQPAYRTLAGTGCGAGFAYWE